MKNDWNFTEMTIFPKVAVNAVRMEIAVEKIPAIQSLAGPACTRNTPESGIFCPTETLFVLENENDTYEVLNDLRRIMPELTRVAAKSIEVLLIDRTAFEASKESEVLLREFLVRIVPRRMVGKNLDIAQFADQGHLDRFHPIYGTKRSAAGNFVSVSAMYVDGQLKPSSFARQVEEHGDPSKRTRRNATQQAKRRKGAEAKRKKKKESRRRKKEKAGDEEQNLEFKKKQRGLFDEE